MVLKSLNVDCVLNRKTFEWLPGIAHKRAHKVMSTNKIPTSKGF